MSTTLIILFMSMASLHRSLNCFKNRNDSVWGGAKVEEVVIGGLVPNNWLFAYRVLVFTFSILFTLLHLFLKGYRPLRFYTKWNFYCLTLYFGTVVWETVWFRRRKAKDRDHPFGPVSYLAILLYHINMTTVWTVDLGSWASYPFYRQNPEFLRQFLLNVYSYVEHILNFFLMFGEMYMNRMPFFDHLRGAVGIWVVVYVFWGFVYRMVTGFWVYPFANTTKMWSPVAYACNFMGHALAFRLFQWFHTMKIKLLSKGVQLLGRAGWL